MCMILSGDGRRLQTCGGLTAQLFDSTLRTFVRLEGMKWTTKYDLLFIIVLKNEYTHAHTHI